MEAKIRKMPLLEGRVMEAVSRSLKPILSQCLQKESSPDVMLSLVPEDTLLEF